MAHPATMRVDAKRRPMPVLKPISGHTSVKPAMRYLEKKSRALAVDLINIDAPAEEAQRATFDWASVMNETRRESGNDRPWRGLRVRTYKHYIISPNPEDGIGLAAESCRLMGFSREAYRALARTVGSEGADGASDELRDFFLPCTGASLAIKSHFQYTFCDFGLERHER